MIDRIVNFASDNTAGAAPEIMESLKAAASISTMPYGDDYFTKRLQSVTSEVFEKEVLIYPVVSGTAANGLSLSTVSPPYGVVFCHRKSHIEEDECAAPEFFIGGGKLTPLDGEQAKFSAETLSENLTSMSPVPPVHRAQPAAVSITQATEAGGIYSVKEINDISEICREHNLIMHMDGARLANAIVGLGVTPAEITWRAGIDVLSLGATKNGTIGAEAVVFFDPTLAADFEFRRKRGGHLLSKMRFLSAQLLPYLEFGRWLDFAENANFQAAELARGLKDVPGVELCGEVETNMIFFKLPHKLAMALNDSNCFFYTWGLENGLVSGRLVTSFNTVEKDVEYFLTTIKSAAEGR